MNTLKFDLTNREIELLNSQSIEIRPDREYSDDEALDLVDLVRDVEISFSQFTTSQGKRLYQTYGSLADKMQRQIPEN